MSEQQPRGDQRPAEQQPPGWAPPPAQDPGAGRPREDEARPAHDGPPGYGRRPEDGGQPPPGHGPPAAGASSPPRYDDGTAGYAQQGSSQHGHAEQGYAEHGYAQQGYARPGGAPRPDAGRDLSPADQRLWATLTHLSGIVTFPVGPLVAFLVLRDRGLFVRDQTRDALNFQITVAAVFLATSVLALVTLGVLSLLPAIAAVVLPVYVLVLGVLAAVRSNRGERYRYPLTLRLVR